MITAGNFAGADAFPKTSRPRGRWGQKEEHMSKVTYEIVEHDGGWAYRVDGVFSEPFASHDLARKAAERAAREQVVPGVTTGITYEDKSGQWHDEVAAGDDRPETDVKG
jgi:hypothetical protein